MSQSAAWGITIAVAGFSVGFCTLLRVYLNRNPLLPRAQWLRPDRTPIADDGDAADWEEWERELKRRHWIGRHRAGKH